MHLRLHVVLHQAGATSCTGMHRDWLVVDRGDGWISEACPGCRWPAVDPWWSVRHALEPDRSGAVHVGVLWATMPLPDAAWGVVARLAAMLVEGYGCTLDPQPHDLELRWPCPPWWTPPPPAYWDALAAERDRLRLPLTRRLGWRWGE